MGISKKKKKTTEREREDTGVICAFEELVATNCGKMWITYLSIYFNKKTGSGFYPRREASESDLGGSVCPLAHPHRHGVVRSPTKVCTRETVF